MKMTWERDTNARRYLNGMTQICYGLSLMVFIAVSGAPTLGKAQSANIYAVTRVEVDEHPKLRPKPYGSHHRGASSRVQPPDDPACTGKQRAGLPVPPRGGRGDGLSFGIDEERHPRQVYRISEFPVPPRRCAAF